MPVRPRNLPPDFEHRVFTADEAMRAGITRDRLRRRDLVQIVPGLYRRRGCAIGEEDIVAAYQRRVPGSFATGLTAARAWGFPLPGVLAEPVVEPSLRAPRRTRLRTPYRARRSGPDPRIHLATLDSVRRSTSLVRWSRVRPEEPTEEAAGIRLTTRPDTFLRLGASVSLNGLVAIGDHLVRRPRPTFEDRAGPFTTIDELKAAAARFAGRGTVRVRESLDLVRVGADSPPETALRLAFVRAGLPEPLPNVRAFQDGVDLGEPDLHWPRWHVIVEYEGPTHRSPEQRRRDAGRDERRRLAGWMDLPMIAADLARGCTPAIARVRTALRACGWTG